MSKKVIKNNLIVISIHAWMCFFFFFPSIFYPRILNVAWVLSNIGIDMFLCLAVGIYTLAALILYFLAGKKLLNNTSNTLTNILSVITPAILLVVYTRYIWNDPFPYSSWGGFVVNLPFEPLIEMIAFLLQIPSGAIEGIYIYLILAPLPSLLMLAGLMVKQRKDKLNKTELQNNENLELAEES